MLSASATVRVTRRFDADHRLAREAKLHGIGDSNDLHSAGVDQALDSLTCCSLAEAYSLGNVGVRATTVALELVP